MSKKRPTVEYVNNEKFYLEMVRYKKLVEESKTKGLPPPRISNYIGDCIMQIAYKVSNSKNFIGYTNNYKEEMIADGIENCILYINNFDPDKSNKPFAYFTQIIWYAFIRRIQKEKKQQFIKAKSLQNFALMDSLNEATSVDSIMPNDSLNDLIVAFEKAELKKKNKKTNNVGLEDIFASEDNE